MSTLQNLHSTGHHLAEARPSVLKLDRKQLPEPRGRPRCRRSDLPSALEIRADAPYTGRDSTSTVNQLEQEKKTPRAPGLKSNTRVNRRRLRRIQRGAVEPVKTVEKAKIFPICLDNKFAHVKFDRHKKKGGYKNSDRAKQNGPRVVQAKRPKGRDVKFDSTLGYPGEGPPKRRSQPSAIPVRDEHDCALCELGAICRRVTHFHKANKGPKSGAAKRIAESQKKAKPRYQVCFYGPDDCLDMACHFHKTSKALLNHHRLEQDDLEIEMVHEVSGPGPVRIDGEWGADWGHTPDWHASVARVRENFFGRHKQTSPPATSPPEEVVVHEEEPEPEGQCFDDPVMHRSVPDWLGNWDLDIPPGPIVDESEAKLPPPPDSPQIFPRVRPASDFFIRGVARKNASEGASPSLHSRLHSHRNSGFNCTAVPTLLVEIKDPLPESVQHDCHLIDDPPDTSPEPSCHEDEADCTEALDIEILSTPVPKYIFVSSKGGLLYTAQHQTTSVATMLFDLRRRFQEHREYFADELSLAAVRHVRAAAVKSVPHIFHRVKEWFAGQTLPDVCDPRGAIEYKVNFYQGTFDLFYQGLVIEECVQEVMDHRDFAGTYVITKDGQMHQALPNRVSIVLNQLFPGQKHPELAKYRADTICYCVNRLFLREKLVDHVRAGKDVRENLNASREPSKGLPNGSAHSIRAL